MIALQTTIGLTRKQWISSMSVPSLSILIANFHYQNNFSPKYHCIYITKKIVENSNCLVLKLSLAITIVI